jgi:hypothetical protein
MLRRRGGQIGTAGRSAGDCIGCWDERLTRESHQAYSHCNWVKKATSVIATFLGKESRFVRRREGTSGESGDTADHLRLDCTRVHKMVRSEDMRRGCLRRSNEGLSDLCTSIFETASRLDYWYGMDNRADKAKNGLEKYTILSTVCV